LKGFIVNIVHRLLLPALLGFAAATAQPVADSTAKADSTYQLQATVIRGRANPLLRKESDQVARIPLKNLENPQAYAVVPKELAQQQLTTDYNGLYKNIPGATISGTWMQGNSQFFTRGFEAAANVRNGLSTTMVTDIDPVNVERLEAIRGPAGALFGSGAGVSYGGLFNIVTKTPYREFGGEASVSGGSFNQRRTTLDVNAPLNAEKTLLLRVNAAKHDEGSYMDQGFANSWTLAPTLVYEVTDRLKFTVDLEIYRRIGTAVPNFYVAGGTTARSIETLGLDPFRSFTDNSLETESRTDNLFVKADYRLTDAWTSETVLASTGSQSNLYSIYLYPFDDSLATRVLDWQAWKVNTRQFQQNFRGDLRLGEIRNQVLAGFGANVHDYLWPYVVTRDTVNYRDVGPGSNYYVGLEQYRARIAANPLSMWTAENYNYYAYVSDAVHFNDRFTALFGIRWDRFEDEGGSTGLGEAPYGKYRQDAWSPKLGLVYQVMKDQVSLYGNLMSGYRNVNGRSRGGEAFDPEHAYQGELGVKAQALAGRFTGTLAAYGIEVQDVVRTDPSDPFYSIQDGTQISYGVEADVAAAPADGLNLVLGYAWNHSEMTRADPDVKGRRPTSAGPAVAANFWAAYELQEGRARGLGAGAGGNYVGESYHQNTSTFVFTVPAYFTVDATVFYNQPAYRLGFKVDNLTDERYWSSGTLLAGSPRRYVGNVTYKF
jgi:iron complex outermembrane receptor protein